MTHTYPFPDVLDSSMLASFKSCRELFRKVYIAEWKSKDPSVHLRAGGAFAKGVECARLAYYAGEHKLFNPETGGWNTKPCESGNAADAEAIGLAALIAHYGDFVCPPDSAKSLQRTAGALEFYFSNYPLNQDSPPIILPSGRQGIEFSFAHPLPIAHPVTGNPLIYSGKMDALLAYQKAGTFITDEKTTSQLGPTWSRQWDLRSQFTGYAWGCRESGVRVDGVIVRGVSILKTKYDTQEAISYRPEWQIERWYNQLLDWVTEMVWCWENEKWSLNLDHSCADYGGCAFRTACASQDETPWLDTFFVRKHWDPISHEETLL